MGIHLTSTSQKIEIVTAGAGSFALDVMASYNDATATTFTPGAQTTAITSATTSDVVDAPASSTSRGISFLSARNKHATDTVTVTVQLDVSGTNVELYSATLLAGEALVFIESRGWVKLTSGGVEQESSATGPVDVQVFTAGVGTWTKPTSFTPKIVEVLLWGAGGGAGGGGSAAAAAIKMGGSGGGGGAHNRRTFRASDLSPTETVTVGAGGNGGNGGAGHAYVFSY